MITASILLILICIAQNTAFSLVSRARNRDNMAYHAIASVLSNGVWFATMKYMIDLDFLGWLVVPYVVGTVTGSLFGAKISMLIEKVIGASADNHVKVAKSGTIDTKISIHPDVNARLKILENKVFNATAKPIHIIK